MPQENQPPITPDPNQGTFTRNILDFYGDFTQGGEIDTAEIVITGTTDNLTGSYDLGTGGTVHDTFVVPVGDDYQINATTNTEYSSDIYDVTFESEDCQQADPNISVCTGTMGTTGQLVTVSIDPQQP
ncbi:MAG: hypothetical protein P0116_16050 [Candidatus Nitrosocosmicus sp.]|nr:hypothetical protein [Candidatus Nitrosocosmicus sp.]